MVTKEDRARLRALCKGLADGDIASVVEQNSRSLRITGRLAGDVFGVVCETPALLDALDAAERDRDDAHATLLKVSAAINAHYNGDDGELTPGQSAKIALETIREALGVPF